jgi:DNA-binding CsgD family transcriptional regulator/PAS domain-containing protein
MGSTYIKIREQEGLNKFAQRHRLQRAEATIPVDYLPFIQGNPILEKIFLMADCGVAIYDINKGAYLYVNKKIEQLLGYKALAYLQGGLAFSLSLVHPDDIDGLLFMLNKKYEYLSSVPVARRLEHRSNMDYRCRKADGTHVRLLMRSQILDFNKAEKRLLRLLLVNDITHLVKDNFKMVNIVLDKAHEFIYTYDVLTKTIQKDHFLSKRELEILHLLRIGLESKDIAKNLFISVHTVETHRRNMLEKTNMKNTSTLVCFAITAGFI